MRNPCNNMAALIFKCIVTWFCVLLSTIFILLQVDEIISWNWFLIFIPLWIYDAIVVVDISLKIGLRRRAFRTQNTQESCGRNVWHLVASFLQLAFQVMLCLYLQYGANLRLVYVMIPFWCVMLGVIVEIGLFVMS